MILMKKYGSGEYEDKKSRFIGQAFVIDSEAAVLAQLEQVRKQHWEARHHCYAYVLDQTVRYSDDGEPSQTAGKPMVELLMKWNVTGCLVVVSRYFGGTLLGTGGLVRAYTNAAKKALESSTFVELMEGLRLEVHVAYTWVAKIQQIISQENAVIEDTSYLEAVIFTIVVETVNARELQEQIIQGTNGQAMIHNLGGAIMEKPYESAL